MASSKRKKNIQIYFSENNAYQMQIHDAIRDLNKNPKYCMYDIGTLVRILLYKTLITGEISIDSQQAPTETQPQAGTQAAKDNPTAKLANDFINLMTD